MSESKTQPNGTNGAAASWSEIYTEAEKLWTGPINEFLGSEFFVRWMETGREVYMSQMDLSRDSLERYWEAVRLPHKGDISNLAKQVVVVENKVEGVEDSVDVLLNRISALGDAIARIESKLDAKVDSEIDRHAAAAKVEKKSGGKE